MEDNKSFKTDLTVVPVLAEPETVLLQHASETQGEARESNGAERIAAVGRQAKPATTDSRDDGQPLISLCLIVGNSEEYIDRCLNSFKCVVDEICIARAIGNLVPDSTIDKARAICESAGIPLKFAEYKNEQPDNLDWQRWKRPGVKTQSWPHLDDFACARNLSFSLATGKYILWADTDDIFGDPDTPSSVEVLRAMAEGASYPIFIFPYRIFGKGMNLMRERLIQRDLFNSPESKWIYPVHECMFFPDTVQGSADERVTITHLPHTNKTGSSDRNLRILEAIPESEMNGAMLYHLHGEYMNLGIGRAMDDRPDAFNAEKYKVKAIECAKAALARDDIGKPERYELFMNLGKMAQGDSRKPDKEVAAQFYHQALATDPTRREALGLLVCNALDRGQPAESLAYARHMIITPPPEMPPMGIWNHRQDAYGWLGVDIYTQALRANGRYKESEEWRRRVLADAKSQGKPIISIVHACYGRPRQSSIIRKLWLDLAEDPDAIEYIMVIDEDDPACQVLRRMHHYTVEGGSGSVAAWNTGAINAQGDIIISMSDDRFPVPRWDKIIIDRFNGNIAEPRVLAVSDGHRSDNLLTMSIVTREYLSQDYFLFHPRFWGVYSDDYFTHVAYARKQVIEARDIVFEHDHPVFNPEKKLDATYARQNDPARYNEGKAIYDELMENRDWSGVPGFFNYWAYYQYVAKNIIQDGDTVAEVGVWFGRSIIYLAQELKLLGKNKVKIYAVDNFQGESNQVEHIETIAQLRKQGTTLREQFQKNIERCGVADMIEILEGDSSTVQESVPNGSLSFCFVDAAHDEYSVRCDITAWLPKMKPGGTMAGHDTQHPPVMSAVRSIFGKDVRVIGPVWMDKQ